MIKQVERGWQGHFCCDCKFHLNTLLERDDGFKVVVSTVGNFIGLNHEMDTIGSERYYETMAFESSYDKYDDMDGYKEIWFESPWRYPDKDDLLPQKGHWIVVEEIKNKMESREINHMPN